MRTKGRRGNFALHTVFTKRKVPARIVQAFLADGGISALSEENREGETPLHLAAARDVDLDVLLCLKNAAATAVEAFLATNRSQGDTPLHAACRAQNRTLINIQTWAEANRQALHVRNKDNSKYLACTTVCQFISSTIDFCHDRRLFTRTFLHYHSHYFAKRVMKRTPLEVAEKCGADAEIVDWLQSTSS